MRHLVRRRIAELSDATEYAKEISAATVGARYGLAPGEITDMSLNVNAFGPPAGAVSGVRDRLDELYKYPDVALRELRERLAQRHGVGADGVILGDGLDEVLKLIAQTFIEPGDEAIIPIPTFPRYQLEVEVMDGRARLVALNDRFEVPVKAILGLVSSRTKLIFICTPNNPTGVPVAREDILRLLALGEGGPLVVVDEAIIFPDDAGVMDLVASHRNLMVLRTFSKYYGLAGARVGYAVGDPDLVSYVDIVRPPFNVNLLGEAAALGALADPHFLQQARAAMDGERQMLMAALAALPGIEPWPSETSIIMFDVGGAGWVSPQVTEALAARGVVVVDCRSYAGLEHKDYIRISIGSRAQNQRLIDGLRSVLAAGPA